MGSNPIAATTSLSKLEGILRVKDYPLTQKTKDTILLLYPEYNTVYGPYYREDGRQHVLLYDSVNKLRITVSFPKILFEILHGIRLKDDETIILKIILVLIYKFSNEQITLEKHL